MKLWKRLGVFSQSEGSAKPESFSQTLERVINLWKRLGSSPRSGVVPASIAAFEEQHDVTLPPQMRQYFLTVDGMEEDYPVNDIPRAIYFWPLAHVKPVRKDSEALSPYAHCYLFADYLLWSHGYAICLGQNGFGEVVVVGGSTPHRVARSFEEFLVKYLDSPQDLL